MNIRKETTSDAEAISEVTIAAFKTLPVSHQTEQFIINALRKADALTISLVAEIDGKIVGHIAFSPVAVSDGSPNWYGLGPINILWPSLLMRRSPKALPNSMRGSRQPKKIVHKQVACRSLYHKKKRIAAATCFSLDFALMR